MIFNTVAVLGVFVVLITNVHSDCYCWPQLHPQSTFCHVKFVVKAYVKEVQVIIEDLQNNWKYENTKIVIKQIFKKSPSMHLEIGKTYMIDGKIEGGICPIHRFEVGKMYVISGTVYKKRLKTDGCWYNNEWKGLSGEVKAGLKGIYSENCKCKIKYCFDQNQPCIPSSDECEFPDYNLVYTRCHKAFSYCRKTTGGRCEWVINKSFENCVPDTCKIGYL